MTNREKFYNVYNDVLADMLCGISDSGIKCKFCVYTTGDCFGKNCFDGIKKWLKTNRNKFNAMDSAELANILKRAFLGDKCNFCSYSSGNCFETNKSCFDGIKKWLSAPGGNELENPPAEERESTDAKKIKKMIKLTIANSHKPIYINPDWIMYMRESSHSDETFIALGAQGATVIVEEDLATIEMHIS